MSCCECGGSDGAVRLTWCVTGQAPTRAVFCRLCARAFPWRFPLVDYTVTPLEAACATA